MKGAKMFLDFCAVVASALPLLVIFLVIWVLALLSGVGSDEPPAAWDRTGAP